MLINDIQDIKISLEPISDELFDISEAYNIIELKGGKDYEHTKNY